MEDNPRDWHNILLDVLWAYRTSPRSCTWVTPYALVYGHDAVLPVEINIKSLRVRSQDQLVPEQYHQRMCLELEIKYEARILALNSILFQKKKAAKNYNKKAFETTISSSHQVDGHHKCLHASQPWLSMPLLALDIPVIANLFSCCKEYCHLHRL